MLALIQATFPRGPCSPRSPGVVLAKARATPSSPFVFAGCLFEQEPADSASLFTLFNISWRMNTQRMRDRVNIAVKIKR